jgi:hypothetical protein
MFSVNTDPSPFDTKYQFNKTIWFSDSTILDHSEALLRCKVLGFDLLTLDTPEEVHDFENAFKEKYWWFHDYTHMGAHREDYAIKGQWIWSADSNKMRFGPRWAEGEMERTKMCSA